MTTPTPTGTGPGLRRLAPSTRRALTSRTSASGALAALSGLGGLSFGRGFRGTGSFEDRAQGFVPPGGFQDRAQGFVPPGGFQDRAQGFVPPGGFADRAPGAIGGGSFVSDTVGRFAGLVPGAIEKAQAASVVQAGRTDDLEQRILDQLAIDLAARDQAIADGEADIAAQFDERIKLLEDQRTKLITGRQAINKEFEGFQSVLIDQQSTLALQEIQATGTDVDAEVAGVAAIADAGEESLNEFLQLIGADDPDLANQLGAEMQQFGELAENALRTNLDSQAQVTAAAGLFAQKAAEAAVAGSRVDAEGARVDIESGLNAKISNIRDAIAETERAKADALDQLRKQIGDFDASQFSDPEAAFGLLLDEWFVGKDMNFEQEAELRNFFQSFYGGLEDRSRAGATAFARQDMFESNSDLILSAFGAEDVTDLSSKIRTMLTTLGIPNPDLDVKDWIETLTGIAKSGNQFGIDALASFLDRARGAGFELPEIELDFVTIEDYADVIDLTELRADWVDGGFDEFSDDVNAQLAGGGFSGGAVDGSKLSRGDMTRTSANGSTAYVHPGAASSFDRMIAAAKADGITLRVGDSYRSFATQKKAFDHFKATQGTVPGKPASWGFNLNNQGVPNIANPGSSNHPKGLAIDFTFRGRNDAAFLWLKKNASRFGWGGIGNEEWHWEFRGGLNDPKSDTPTEDEDEKKRPL